MVHAKNNRPLLRAVAVLSAVAVLVTGVTYAALQSQPAQFTNNSIESATADLRVGTSASTFSTSRSGFSFDNVVPGGPAMPAAGFNLYLKNYGTTPLAIKLGLGGTLANTKNIDLAKVKLIVTRVDNEAVQTFTLQQLSEGAVAYDVTLPGAVTGSTANVVQYKLQAQMDDDAVTGDGIGATITGFNLVFSGVPAL